MERQRRTHVVPLGQREEDDRREDSNNSDNDERYGDAHMLWPPFSVDTKDSRVAVLSVLSRVPSAAFAVLNPEQP
jgi:hypothetical protein